EMHIADMAHDTSNPNPGDLIEIKRPGYQHWALYVGDGYVIHVTATDEKALAVSTSAVTILTKRATVKKELLKDVAKKDKWYVSNKHDWYRVPYPAEEIIRRAESWIGKDVSYRLLLRNCEHFVTTLRYGEGLSDQVS
ncbi:HRSL1 enzyme, partial [Malurus elegans]|nr:HRSL1 enzyme [Malurus elegans]